MSFEIEQLLRPAPSCAQRAGIPEPNDAAFAQAFADLLVGENLVDAAAISRARRAAEAASERLDFVLVKLGLISESDLCIAYATYCDLPLVGPGDVPEQPVLADRLKLSFLKANRLLSLTRSPRASAICSTSRSILPSSPRPNSSAPCARCITTRAAKLIRTRSRLPRSSVAMAASTISSACGILPTRLRTSGSSIK